MSGFRIKVAPSASYTELRCLVTWEWLSLQTIDQGDGPKAHQSRLVNRDPIRFDIEILRRFRKLYSFPKTDRRALASFYARLYATEIRRRLSLRDGVCFSTRLYERTVATYYLDSLQFLVDEIFLTGTYDVGELPPRPVIVDCGANIGIASLYFVHRYPDCRIIAFEPDPAAYRLLDRNLQHYPNVQLFDVALGNRNSTLEFFEDSINKASLCASAFQDRPPNSRAITVNCVRLSDLLPSHVDLLKIDVEGMEWEILDDLESTGLLQNIERLAIEYHHHLSLEHDHLGVFLGRLERAGFGYDLGAYRSRGLGPRFQDVMIYAYRKSSSGSLDGAAPSARTAI